jgi:hypothetical protein
VDSYSAALYDSESLKESISLMKARAGCKRLSPKKKNRSAAACSMLTNHQLMDMSSEIEFFAPPTVACGSFINHKAEHCCCLAACVANQKNQFGGNQL